MYERTTLEAAEGGGATLSLVFLSLTLVTKLTSPSFFLLSSAFSIPLSLSFAFLLVEEKWEHVQIRLS